MRFDLVNLRLFLFVMGGVQLSEADLSAVADYVWAIGHQNRV